MSVPLTNAQEPGFFSEVTVSPSLFLIPGSVQVVGLIAEGSSTKSVSESLTRGVTLGTNYEILLSPISRLDLASSTNVFRYPQSSFGSALRGTVDVSSLSYPGDVSGDALEVVVDGLSAELVTFTNASTSAAAMVAEFNAAMTRVQAELDADNRMVIFASGNASSGLSFTIGAGTTSDATLGFPITTRANAVRWDSSIMDSDFAPQAGDEYKLTYQTLKLAADFAPKSFFGLSQVIAAYGDVSSDGTVFHSMAAGAQAAFGNGASIVTCRQLDPAMMGSSGPKQSEIVSALSDMESQQISILVVMVSLNDAVLGYNMGPTYLQHVSKMSSLLERSERICITGLDETAGRLAIRGDAPSWQSYAGSLQPPLSSGLASKRMVLVNPGSATVLHKGVNYLVNGTYAAACLAGEMVNSNFDQAEPMTRKSLSTIKELILPDLTRVEKNDLTRLGVTVVESSNQTILVRRSLTLDSSSIANQEPSIVRAFDLVASDLRSGLENRFVGTKILNTTHTAIEAATATFLERLVVSEIISSYRNIKAVQNKVEPRQFDVSFEAAPIFPFLWGYLDISIILS